MTLRVECDAVGGMWVDDSVSRTRHTGSELASGAYGTVDHLSLKSVPKRIVIKVAKSTTPKSLDTEIRRLLQLQNLPGIIQIQGWGHTIDVSPRAYILLPEYDFSLWRWMTLHRHRTGSEMLEIAYQIAKVLVVIHDLGVVHGDLSPNNILVTWRADGTLDLVLTDLDFPDEKYVPQNGMVTFHYRAPECDVPMTLIESTIDIWAFGIILVELFSGISLFPPGKPTRADKIANWIDHTNSEKFTGVLIHLITCQRPDIDPQMIDHIARIVEQCLRVDPVQRPGASEIVVQLENCPNRPISSDDQSVSKKAMTCVSALFDSMDSE